MAALGSDIRTLEERRTKQQREMLEGQAQMEREREERVKRARRLHERQGKFCLSK